MKRSTRRSVAPLSLLVLLSSVLAATPAEPAVEPREALEGEILHALATGADAGPLIEELEAGEPKRSRRPSSTAAEAFDRSLADFRAAALHALDKAEDSPAALDLSRLQRAHEAFFAVAGLGFISKHDEARDNFEAGKITEEEYWRETVKAAAKSGTVLAASVVTGGAAAVGSRAVGLGATTTALVTGAVTGVGAQAGSDLVEGELSSADDYRTAAALGLVGGAVGRGAQAFGQTQAAQRGVSETARTVAKRVKASIIGESTKKSGVTTAAQQVTQSAPANSAIRDRVRANIAESQRARAARTRAQTRNEIRDRVRDNVAASRRAREARAAAQVFEGTPPSGGTPSSLMDDIIAEANLVATPGHGITEAQATILRQNLPVVQRRDVFQNRVMRREFVRIQERLKADWERHMSQTWPFRATPHHILPLESGGANKWYNLMPTHGTTPNHALQGVPGPHAKGGVLRETIQRGPVKLPPGTNTDLRRSH